MPTYSDEKRRVIRKLADYLRLMGLRTHKIAKSSCFVTFGESPPEDDGSKTLKSSVGIVAGCSSRCSSDTEDGEVPNLSVTNSSDRPILIPEGEILVGAKQNRVVNVTVLVAARSTFKVPVSCVEQGRWRYL